jgi:hypothetical protein
MSKGPFLDSSFDAEGEHDRFKFGTIFAIIMVGRKGTNVDIFPSARYDFLHFRRKHAKKPDERSKDEKNSACDFTHDSFCQPKFIRPSQFL